jgi:hypothetical protein
MRITGLAPQKQPVPQQTFSDRAHLFCDPFAGRVTDSNEDLDPNQSKLPETELG